MKNKSTYQELKPSEDLEDLIHSFWNHQNQNDSAERMTIVPDSFFKIIILVKDNRITNYFMTGIWTENREFTIPPKTATFGCRLRILAPEYLIQREVASVLDSIEQLNLSFLNIQKFNFTDFDLLKKQWETELRNVLSDKPIQANKLRLSQLLYKMKGEISASEVSSQIFWANRQINRYMNQWLGVSLKTYLNIQKCYESYLHIREGQFYPESDYFDQAHFIREVKKHTGETPTSLYKQQNDRFIQLKNIQQK